MQAPTVPRTAIPAGYEGLVVAELGPAGLVLELERRFVVRAVDRVVAAAQRHGGQGQEGQAPRRVRARGGRAEVERERATVARAGGVGAAAIVGAQLHAGAVSLPQHHQAAPFSELDEAFGLAGHVDGVWREPIDQRAGSETRSGCQACDVERRDRGTQVATAIAARGAAKILGRNGGARAQRRRSVAASCSDGKRRLAGRGLGQRLPDGVLQHADALGSRNREPAVEDEERHAADAALRG
jgi:hypothetical protein